MTGFAAMLYMQYGCSALWCASDAGDTECVKVLVKYGAQIDLPVRHDVQKWVQSCGVQTGQLMSGV